MLTGCEVTSQRSFLRMLQCLVISLACSSPSRNQQPKSRDSQGDPARSQPQLPKNRHAGGSQVSVSTVAWSESPPGLRSGNVLRDSGQNRTHMSTVFRTFQKSDSSIVRHFQDWLRWRSGDHFFCLFSALAVMIRKAVHTHCNS